MIRIEQHIMNPKTTFYINRIEDEATSNFGIFHKHKFFEIIWITETNEEEIQLIDFKHHKIQPNKLWILTPNQVHYWSKSQKKGWIIALQSDVFLNITKQINIPFFNEIVVNINPQKNQILNSLMQLVSISKKEKNTLVTESYINAFILNLKSEIEAQVSLVNPIGARSTSILNLIEEFYKTEKETVFYAAKIGLTPKRINEILKQATSKTIKQHLTDRIIIEAKRDLAINLFSIKEIAFNLGFQSASHFTKFFKQQTNLAPEKYKENLMYNLNK